jgi:hypothetical protein
MEALEMPEEGQPECLENDRGHQEDCERELELGARGVHGNPGESGLDGTVPMKSIGSSGAPMDANLSE